MTWSVWRFLLTCLLLIALPFRGFAAASMLACGPNHHQMYGTIAQNDGLIAQDWHDHGDGVSHHHEDDQPFESRTMDSGYPPDDAVLAGHASQLNAKFKCGTCAPCCAGAALTDDVPIQFAAAVSIADFPAFTIVHRSAPVGRLDRPPRIILA